MSDPVKAETEVICEVINRAMHEHVCGPWPWDVCCWTEETATCAEVTVAAPGMALAVQNALSEAGWLRTAANPYAWGPGLSPLLPPTWVCCGVGGPREASSDCIRVEHHGGEHEDSSGGTWLVAEEPRYRPAPGAGEQ